MNSINLIEKAHELKAQLEATIANNPQLPAKPKEVVNEAIAQIAALVEKLHTISDNYIDLTNIKTGEKDLQKNAHFWDNISPGQITEETLSDLVMNHSMTLKTLYQGAIDVRQISKFDQTELSIARELGENFSIYQYGWSRFKAALTKHDQGAQFKAGEVHAIKDFLTMLRKYQVIRDFKFQYARYQGSQSFWEETNLGYFRKLHHNHPSRCEFIDFDKRYYSFLTGHWFNAYAYIVFEDQLKRLDSDFEIYPRVQFEYAAAGRRMKGDFDVIINIGKRLLLVECKSGWITNERGRDDFTDIVDKTEMLKKAFGSTRIADYAFFLLFNPEVNDQQMIQDYFGTRKIEAVTPGEIRGVVIDKIRDMGNFT